MLEQVITGGQTGADQGAWRAAKRAGIATGGWMPRGYLTEDGPRSDFAGEFAAREHPSDLPDDRTLANVGEADATLIFAGSSPSPGTQTTIDACRRIGSPHLFVEHPRSEAITPELVARWIRERGVRCLNVAGDRESQTPGIDAFVDSFLSAVLERLHALSASSD